MRPIRILGDKFGIERDNIRTAHSPTEFHKLSIAGNVLVFHAIQTSRVRLPQEELRREPQRGRLDDTGVQHVSEEAGHMQTPDISAIPLTMKSGPLPMYVIRSHEYRPRTDSAQGNRRQ